MDALNRHWKRLKENPSTMVLVGGTLVVVLLSWFVLAVRAVRHANESRQLWAELSRLRRDPGEAFYITPGEFEAIRAKARQQADDAERMAQLGGQRRENPRQVWNRTFNMSFNFELAKRLYQGVPQVHLGDPSAENGDPRGKPDLARPSDDTLKRLSDLAAQNANRPIGAWLYFHLGNLHFARAHDADSAAKADEQFELAQQQYEQCQSLLTTEVAVSEADADGKVVTQNKRVPKAEGHVLTDPQFDLLGKALARTKAQRQWVAQLATRGQTPVAPAGGNPIVKLVTTKGVVKLELFIAESPALVRRVCALVDRGYYDGRAFYGADERLGVGSPFDNDGSSELGEGLRPRITEREHTLGTVSMDSHGLDSELASSTRIQLLKRDPAQSNTGWAGFNRYDGAYAVIGQVQEDSLPVLAELAAGDRILAASFDKTGAYRAGFGWAAILGDDRPEKQSKAGESKAGESKAREPKAGEAKAGDEKAGESKAGESKAGEAKAGDEKAGESKAGDEKAGEANGEQPKKGEQPEPPKKGEQPEPPKKGEPGR